MHWEFYWTAVEERERLFFFYLVYFFNIIFVAGELTTGSTVLCLKNLKVLSAVGDPTVDKTL